MFCPKCATQNLDGASYCRSCGVNLSLIPQALNGQLLSQQTGEPDLRQRIYKRYGRELTLDRAFKSVFMGMAFLLIAIALSFSSGGGGWWFWMLIPAFSMMGGGIAQYIRLKEVEKRASIMPPVIRPAMNQSPRLDVFPARNTGELMPTPPSVTEGTTRHLATEAQTRQLEDAPK
jgi:hypothetical protein